MVCLDDGVTCVPKHSITGGVICLPGSSRCDGIDDCVGGYDEEDCPAFLPGGIQALIAILVIGVIVMIPVIYVIVRKKQNKPVIPAVFRPMLDRLPCCHQGKENGDRSSHELTHVSNQSDKDGFTNVGFSDHSPNQPAATTSQQQQQQYSVTGRPLNKFKQPVTASELERVPSYRDWQANRLQQPGRNSQGSPRQSNIGAHQVQINTPTKGYNNERVQPQAVVKQGPITYSASANRPNSEKNSQPYAIASPDGKSKYEARTHMRDYQPGREPVGQQPPWQRPADGPAVGGYHGETSQPPNYDNYMQASSAVPPSQLREALEKVAGSSPYDTGYSSRGGAGSPRNIAQYSPQYRNDRVSPRYGNGAYQRSPQYNTGYSTSQAHDPSDDTVV